MLNFSLASINNDFRLIALRKLSSALSLCLHTALEWVDDVARGNR